MAATTTITQILDDENKTIEQFYDRNKIPYIYIHVGKKINKEGKEVKDVKGTPPGWQNWTYERCMTENKKDKGKHTAVCANLRNSEFCVIDIDDEDLVCDLLEKYGDTYSTFSLSKKLPHLYRRRAPGDNNCKTVIGKGYDIIYSNIFESPSSELQAWDKQYGEMPVYKNQVKPKTKTQTFQYGKQYDPNKVSEFDRDILDNIDIKYWEEYEHWFKLVSAIVKEKNNVLLADEYSKKASNYGGINEVIDRTSNAINADISWGTVMYYSKQSNPEKHQQIVNMYNIEIDLTDAGVATMLLKICKNEFIFQDGILYYCNGSNPFWKFDDEDNGVKHKIYLDLLEFYNDKDLKVSYRLNQVRAEITLLSAGGDKNNDKIMTKDTLRGKLEEEREQIKKGILHAKTNNRKSNYVAALKEQLSQQEVRINFDTLRPYVFCFLNCNIDVRTKEIVEIHKHDYITKRVAYDYVKPTQDQTDTLTQIIERILPEPENRKCYISVLWSCLIGLQIEKFVVDNGPGRNGKGVVNELLEALLTNVYFYTANVSCLTENQSSGANQEIANMDGMRCVLASEPNDSLKLKLGNIKSMTGNSKQNARALYSKKTDVNMQNMTILECNNIPSIEGRIDASAAERFMIIDFIAHFTNDETKLKLMKNCYPLDTRYKTDEFKQEYKCALFDYILSFGFTEIYLPDIVKKRTKKYLVGCDDFLTWFNEKYEHSTNKEDIIKMADLYAEFKQSDMWDSMAKADRRQKWTKDKMINNIKNNISLGFYFKDRYQVGQNKSRNCLIFHRKREVVVTDE